MLPIIPKPAITAKQKKSALAVAAMADTLQLIIFPLTVEGGFSPVQDVIDFITAIALIVICGFKWQFILAFLLELVPALDLFPTWTAVALMLQTSDEPVGATPVYPSAPLTPANSAPNFPASAPSSPPSHPPIEVTPTLVPPVQSSAKTN